MSLQNVSLHTTSSIWDDLDATLPSYTAAKRDCSAKDVVTASLTDDVEPTSLHHSSAFPDLPSTLVVTRAPENSRWARHSTHSISPPDGSPLLTSYHHVVMAHKATIAIHPGSSTAMPAIATAKFQNAVRERSTLTVVAHDGVPETSERLDVHRTFAPELWIFVWLVTGPNGEKEVEKFEWRQTHGPEATQLWGTGKKTRGWKLVRVNGTQRSGPTEKKGDERGAGWTRDGKEIVAVWVDDELKLRTAGVVAKFGLLGSGMSDSERDLGKEWRMMALLSGLRLRQIRRLRG